MCVYENLKNLNIVLPPPQKPGGPYVQVKQVGNLLFVPGTGPYVNGEAVITGQLGTERTIEEGQEAARICILNTLAYVQAFLGDLNKIKSVVKLLGFVASAPGFGKQPAVINGGSQLLVDLFGDKGKHARSAIGVNEMANNISVEIEVIFEVES
jgi:enamine deaminase RidA (YjgF/YER057c/UK114 family)